MQLLDTLAKDTHYKYLLVFLVPVTLYAVIINWWGLKVSLLKCPLARTQLSSAVRSSDMPELVSPATLPSLARAHEQQGQLRNSWMFFAESVLRFAT